MKQLVLLSAMTLFLSSSAFANDMRQPNEAEITSSYKVVYNTCVEKAETSLTEKLPNQAQRDDYVHTTCQCGVDKLKAKTPGTTLAYLNDYYAQKITNNETNQATYDMLLKQFTDSASDAGSACADEYIKSHPKAQ